jgi:tRNA U34 5-carboxymethylaminomethyl modifying GTPase MnmE/TrmE
MLKENKKWVTISAVTGKNIDKLEKAIGKIFQNNVSQNNEDVSVKAYGN